MAAQYAAEQIAAAAAQLGIRDDEPDEEMCIVCMADVRRVVLLPCGHLALCGRCWESMRRNERPLCPVGREVVTGIHVMDD